MGSIRPVLVIVCVGACDARVARYSESDGSADGDATSISASTSDGQTDPGTAGMTSSADVSSSDTSAGSDESSSACVPALYNKDLGADGVCDHIDGQIGRSECTTWLDLCPDGMKCFDLNDSPSGGYCGEIVQPVAPAYGPCTTDLVSETDDCDRGYSCEAGVCQPRATCSKIAPHCDEATSAWAGYSNICTSACRLLDPICPQNFRCYWSVIGGLCGPEGRGSGDADVGERCDHNFDCAPVGLFGAICYGNIEGLPPIEHDPLRIPGCTGERCCAEICEIPDGACSDPSAECTPIGIDAQSNQCADGAGVCLLPS